MGGRLGLPSAYAYKPPRFYEVRRTTAKMEIRVERKDGRHRRGGLFRYLKYSPRKPDDATLWDGYECMN